jgi:putative acyl-CoA dehydrogenase
LQIDNAPPRPVAPELSSDRVLGGLERLALCLQGSLLVRHAPAAVAEVFGAPRLGGVGGGAYGTLPRGIDTAAIVDRHRPRLG